MNGRPSRELVAAVDQLTILLLRGPVARCNLHHLDPHHHALGHQVEAAAAVLVDIGAATWHPNPDDRHRDLDALWAAPDAADKVDAWADPAMTICGQCKGTGEVTARRWRYFGVNGVVGEPHRRSCPDCAGAGRARPTQEADR